MSLSNYVHRLQIKYNDLYEQGRLPDGRIVAIKKLTGRHETTEAAEEFLTEVRVLTSVRHRNLVRLLGCCTRGHERLLVYEFMSNNSLNKHLFGMLVLLIWVNLLIPKIISTSFNLNEALRYAGDLRSALTWKMCLNIIMGTSQGIAYLHEDSQVRIIHRDIKCPNILLDDRFCPKIADFGLARFFPEDETHVSTRVGGTM